MDIEAAKAIAKQIQNRVKALQLPHPNSPSSKFITLSLGLASIIPHQQVSYIDLIAVAHQGLYQAKAQERNCLVSV